MAGDGEAVDRFAYDEAGIRRFIRAGDPVPKGWTVESTGGQTTEPEPKRKSSKPKRAVKKKG